MRGLMAQELLGDLQLADVVRDRRDDRRRAVLVVMTLDGAVDRELVALGGEQRELARPDPDALDRLHHVSGHHVERLAHDESIELRHRGVAFAYPEEVRGACVRVLDRPDRIRDEHEIRAGFEHIA